MKNKLILLGMCILTLIFVISFSEKVKSFEGTSDNYEVRLAIGNLASNTTTGTTTARIYSDFIASNLTSPGITAGRLSILKNSLPPKKPDLNLPNNQTFSKTEVVEFSWSNTTDPNQLIDKDKIRYYIEIYNDSELTKIYHSNFTIEETANTTKTNLSIPEQNINLFWQVIVNDGNSNSTSELREFIKDSLPPTAVNLQSPANGTTTSDNTPSLAWTATNETNFENYTIEFSTSVTYDNPNYTQISTTNSFSNWTTELEADTYFWKIVSFDKSAQFNESAEQFSLTVEGIINTVTTTIPTGEVVSRAGGVKRKPFNLDIIAPPSVTIYSEDSVIVPLIITNQANEIVLNGINLNVSSESEDVSPILGSTFIPRLRPKEQRQIPLTIVTHTDPGAYGIVVTAIVNSPKFTDSVKIFANLIERDSTSSSSSEKQIIFAKELFSGNSACLELNEYITQAEEELANQRYDKALNLANNAIEACKDLVALVEEQKPDDIEVYIEKAKDNKDIIIIAIESLVFLIVLLIVIKVIKRKK